MTSASPTPLCIFKEGRGICPFINDIAIHTQEGRGDAKNQLTSECQHRKRRGERDYETIYK